MMTHPIRTCCVKLTALFALAFVFPTLAQGALATPFANLTSGTAPGGVLARADTAMISFSQQISVTDTQGSVIDNAFVIGYDVTFNVSLPQFDPALGTLTGVQIASRSISNPSLSATLTNTGSEDFQGDNRSGVSSIFSFPGGLIGATSGGGIVPFNLAAGESTTIDFGPISEIDQVYRNTFAPSIDLAPYVGTGNFTGTVSPGVSASLNPIISGSVDDLVGTLNAAATAEFTVTYTFEPVPEPTTFAFLALGGFAIVGRRHR